MILCRMCIWRTQADDEHGENIGQNIKLFLF